MTKSRPTVISLFCGIGGSSCGYRMAGYHELAAVDWDELALAAFRRNFPTVKTIRANLFTYPSKQLMRDVGIEEGELDVLDGSPPCQGFSQIRGSKRTGDKRNGLVFQYAAMVRTLQPRVAIMENVAGMATARMIGILDALVEKISKAGYRVEWNVLSAADYGVPQDRRRVILVAVRKDLGIDPVFPKPLKKQVTAEEALATVKGARGIPVDGLPITGEGKRMLKGMKQGETLEVGMAKEYGYRFWGFNDRRLVADRPAFTLAATVRLGQGGYMLHPTEDRLLSVDELKVLCGFPQDFILGGSFEERVKGLGNAVMPPLMAAVAGEVKRRVLT